MITKGKGWINDGIEEILKEHFPHSPIEEFPNWNFVFVWQELGYQKEFDAYKEDITKRVETSFDPVRMMDMIIKEKEIENIQYNDVIYQTDGIKRGVKIGYGIALNGENPNICDLIFNIKYHFDQGFHDCKFTSTFEERVNCELSSLPVSWKFKSLHEVCEGYLRAKIVYYLKNYRNTLLKDDTKISNSNPENEVSETEFKNKTQKIAWFHNIGILNPILEESKEGATYNFRKAARIINTFCDINIDTIRKALEAIYSPSEGNKRNNPLNNPETQLFLLEMRKKYKLNK